MRLSVCQPVATNLCLCSNAEWRGVLGDCGPIFPLRKLEFPGQGLEAALLPGTWVCEPPRYPHDAEASHVLVFSRWLQRLSPGFCALDLVLPPWTTGPLLLPRLILHAVDGCSSDQVSSQPQECPEAARCPHGSHGLACVRPCLLPSGRTGLLLVGWASLAPVAPPLGPSDSSSPESQLERHLLG